MSMNWSKTQAIAIIFLIIFMVAGCGDNGGGSGIPPEQPFIETSGYAVDALIEGGTVTAYSWTNAKKGDVLGSTTTDKFGYYSLSIQAPPQPILLELTGGAYTEEASGKRISLKADQSLYAAVNFGGNTVDIMITPYTTLAAGLAEYYITKSGIDTQNAITRATSEITGITVFNILDEYPLNITDDANRTDELTDGHMYGFFCAALSAWAADLNEQNGLGVHDVYTSIYLTQLMYNDVVYDGVLNGYGLSANGRPGNLSAGSVVMDAETYRLQIGYHIILAAGADYNHTGLTVEDVLTQAEMFSQRVNGLFGYEDPLPMDAKGPDILQTEPIGKQYRGVIQYGFHIEDPVGISDMSVTIDGDPVEASIPIGPGSDVLVEIDTENYADGSHVLMVVATDMLGNESTQEFKIYINNSGILLSVDPLPALTNADTIEVKGTFESTGTLINSITINGAPATIQQQNHTFSILITLQNGANPIHIEATDTIGNNSTVDRVINCDRVAPTIDTSAGHEDAWFYADGRKVGMPLEDENSLHPLYFSYNTVSLNGTEIVKTTLLEETIPYFIFKIVDSPDNGVSTQSNDLVVSMIYSRKDATPVTHDLVANGDSDNEFLIPLVTEFIGDFYNCAVDDTHTITVRVTDQAGNVSQKIFTFKAYVDAATLSVSSLSVNSNVTVYAYDNGAKNGVITSGKTSETGTATLKLFSSPRPIMVELTNGNYLESGTGATVTFVNGQSLQAVTNFEGNDLDVSVTPLTNVAASLAGYNINQGQSAVDAISSANTQVSNIYGVDVVDTPIVDIANAANATSVCTDDYRYAFILAGLSMWTLDAATQNGDYGQGNYNSLMLSERMAQDIANDGHLNGSNFGAVNIDSNVYRNGFGTAILGAISSPRNATMLTAKDFLGVDMQASRANEEIDISNTPFAARGNMLGREFLSTIYTVSNPNAYPVIVQVTAPPTPHTCVQEYYNAVRVHTVKRNTVISYRARTNYNFLLNGPTPASVQGDWKGITYYLDYQNGQWQTVRPPTSAQGTEAVLSDAVPGRYESGWQYFIIKFLRSTASANISELHSVLGNRPAYVAYFDFAAPELAATTGMPPTTPEANNATWSAVRMAPVDVNDATIIRPEIQKNETYTFETVDGPRDVISETQTKSYSFAVNRLAAETPGGAAAAISSGGYVIPPKGSILIKRYVTTPTFELYGTGNPTYAAALYDKALAWTINASLNLNLSLTGQNESMIGQMPLYAVGQNGSRTFTISR